MKSLQDTYAPENRCFGCGPANDAGPAHQELRRGRRQVVADWRPAAAPPGLRRHPERRHLRRAARLPQQLGRGPSPDDAVRRRDPALHRHRRLPRDPEAADADGRARCTCGPRRRVEGGPGGRRGDARGQRQGHGDLPRHVRGGQAGASGVSPLVTTPDPWPANLRPLTSDHWPSSGPNGQSLRSVPRPRLSVMTNGPRISRGGVSSRRPRPSWPLFGAAGPLPGGDGVSVRISLRHLRPRLGRQPRSTSSATSSSPARRSPSEAAWLRPASRARRGSGRRCRRCRRGSLRRHGHEPRRAGGHDSARLVRRLPRRPAVEPLPRPGRDDHPRRHHVRLRRRQLLPELLDHPGADGGLPPAGRARRPPTCRPPATGTVFADVAAGDFAADWIEQLHAEGITGGCGTSPLRYCPGSAVTRGQMAVFLLKVYHGVGLRASAGAGRLRRRPGLLSPGAVDRGARAPGRDDGLRRHELLPDQLRHAGPDGGLPGEDVPPAGGRPLSRAGDLGPDGRRDRQAPRPGATCPGSPTSSRRPPRAIRC